MKTPNTLDLVRPENIILPARDLRRIDTSNGRYYKDYDTGEIAISTTTVGQNGLPTGYGLKQFYKNNTAEDIHDILDSSSKYGNAYHILCEKVSKKGTVTIDDAVSTIEDESADITRVNEMMKDVASFAKFIKDRNVEIIATEIMIMNGGMAGTVDIVCKMDFNSKRINAIIDIKSGKKGFFTPHRFQLGFYQRMWNNESNFEITHIFNFAPNDWKTEPTYKLENQTGKVTNEQLDACYSLALMVCPKEPKPRNYVTSVSLEETVIEVGV
jgi:hypothetical protein